MREVREETGLAVTLSRLVGFYSRPDWCNGGDNDALYVGQPTSGRFINESDEVKAIGFFDPDELPHPMVGWHSSAFAMRSQGPSSNAHPTHALAF